MRWRGPIILATALMLPLAACATEGEEAGEADIEVDAEMPDQPDIIVEDQEPDVIIEDRTDDDGVSGSINVDEDGNVSGNVDVDQQ